MIELLISPIVLFILSRMTMIYNFDFYFVFATNSSFQSVV